MKVIRFLLPIMVVAAGLVGSALLVKFGKKTEPIDPPAIAPLVETIVAELRDHPFTVQAQGNVSAHTEIDLAAEISGKIEWISDALAAGGFFEKGDALVRIEKRDFELAVVSAEAQLAQAKAALAREKAEAAVAVREWNELGKGDASALLKREPQLAQAKAAVNSAEALIEKAKRDLERCVITAPFDGRVERKGVDAGQFVNRGAPLGRLYAVDRAEVRLPIPEEDLAFLDLPLAFQEGDGAERPGPSVRLRATIAGKEQNWTGKIVRTEGRIDSQSRMTYAVAQVMDPYGRKSDIQSMPLAVGLFVSCEVEGRVATDTATLPRRALRNRNEVWTVDADSRLHVRQVDVLRAGRDTVVIGSGLKRGERVCVSSLDAVVDGMKVRLAEPANSQPETRNEQEADQ